MSTHFVPTHAPLDGPGTNWCERCSRLDDTTTGVCTDCQASIRRGEELWEAAQEMVRVERAIADEHAALLAEIPWRF